MRNRYYVCYDIADPARWRRVWKAMLGFGDPVQLSVFQCDLSAKEAVLLEGALREVIHHGEDRVLIVDAGPCSGRGASSAMELGKRQAPLARRTVVV